MKLKEQLQNIRQKAFAIIKDIVDKHGKLQIEQLYDFIENNGELQLCKILTIEYYENSYIITHRGELNYSIDTSNIMELSSDLLINLSNQIQQL